MRPLYKFTAPRLGSGRRSQEKNAISNDEQTKAILSIYPEQLQCFTVEEFILSLGVFPVSK